VYSRTGVEKLRQPVAISAVLHAATVAWLATRALPPAAASEAVAATPIEIVSIAPAEAPPVEPARVPALPTALPEVAAAPDAPVHAPRIAATRPAAPAERAGAVPEAAPEVAVTVPAAEPRAGSAPGRSWMRMRGTEPPRLELPAGRWDDLDRPPAGTVPERDPRTGLLHESGGGTRRYEHGGFGADVAPDGSVTLRDKASFHAHLALPSPRALGRSLATWYESDKGPSGKEGDTGMAKKIQGSTGLAGDAPTVIVPVLGGGFEVTDWLMRRKGIDPYASKKLRVLDATRDERVQIGNRHRAGRLAMTPQLMRRNLEALWAETTDPGARKRALFALWDECAETGEREVVAGGEAARRYVIGFIRARLPAASADAFTPTEIAELARTQHSKATFQPYE
jgi:hypothetical protein